MSQTFGLPRHRVYAVVVSYRCDFDRLSMQFERLLPQVERIVWVDNGRGPQDPGWMGRWPSNRVQTLWLGGNHGIGFAQNQGIDCAIRDGATHVLLMDDDSLPAPDMVHHLMRALTDQASIAAAGPNYADARRRQTRSPFFRMQWSGIHRLTPHVGGEACDVDYLISSGMLIPVAVLQRVGPMREDFFIDWVDVEWCFRARRLGYALRGVFDARMEHRVGGDIVRVLGREVALHPPWRHYYQVRNLVLLFRAPGLPARVRWAMAIRQIQRLGAILLAVSPRRDYIRSWVQGLVDGLRGRTGPLAQSESRDGRGAPLGGRG